MISSVIACANFFSSCSVNGGKSPKSDGWPDVCILFPSAFSFLSNGHVVIVDPLAFEFMEPGGAGHILTTVFVPVDVRVLPKHTGQDEGADIETDPVVEVRLPADGLFFQRLPADENVAWYLSLQNLFQ